ncbi:hypothetical protein AKJ29_10805 [Aliiroseovarius crassostreae]|uniref:Uncharacterized protein n=1 Tax=Aliiroseovarius crassostreae TaxID=154981 RepID=A0A0P7KM64_9RHOB|nr:hypothetical protein AKJ29_10805 [Aliiroseovarius crassostreae]
MILVVAILRFLPMVKWHWLVLIVDEKQSGKRHARLMSFCIGFLWDKRILKLFIENKKDMTMKLRRRLLSTK